MEIRRFQPEDAIETAQVIARTLKISNSKDYSEEYEITSRNGEKSTYADQLWIDTSLSIHEVEALVSIMGVAEPCDIRYFCDCDEVEYCHIYLISQSKSGEPIISEIEKEKAGQIVTLFWD